MKEVPARLILWIMAFLSYALQNVLVSNLSIAITDMVETRENGSQPDTFKQHSAETFAWDEKDQGMVIGAPYWMLPVGNVVSSLLSHITSPKLVIGYSILFGSILNVATPFAANLNYWLLFILRLVLGFIVGLAFPPVLTIVPHWVPLSERGRFVSCVVGYNFGSAVVNFLGSWLIDYVNWKAVFYVPGIMGIAWCGAWKYLMYDRPNQHPRVSDTERALLSSISPASKRNPKSIPWKRILLSTPVWVNILSQFACVWTWLIFTSYGPIFLKNIHHMSIRMVGLAIGMPFVLRAIACLLFSVLTDSLIINNLMTVTNVRKLSIFIACVLPGISLIVQVLFEENIYVTVASVTLIIICTSMNINGGVAGMIDISPNFGGAIQGISSACTLAGGFIIPIVISNLTYNNNTLPQWRKFFLLTSAMCFVSGIVFIFAWSSNVKAWNDDQNSGDANTDRELACLKYDERSKKVNKINGY